MLLQFAKGGGGPPATEPEAEACRLRALHGVFLAKLHFLQETFMLVSVMPTEEGSRPQAEAFI